MAFSRVQPKLAGRVRVGRGTTSSRGKRGGLFFFEAHFDESFELNPSFRLLSVVASGEGEKGFGPNNSHPGGVRARKDR